MKSRTENAIRNRYNSLMKKVRKNEEIKALVSESPSSEAVSNISPIIEDIKQININVDKDSIKDNSNANKAPAEKSEKNGQRWLA